MYLQAGQLHREFKVDQKMLKTKLEAIKSQDSNLYEHLVSVIRQLILNNDKDGYHLFQYYSQNIQKIQNQSHEYRREEFEQLKHYLEKQTSLLDKPSTGTEEEPIEVGPCGYIPNLLEECKLFEKVGVGLGEQLTYQVFKSLERFSINKQVKQLKFWGRVNCCENDYFIAESPAEAGDDGQLPADVEPKGTGINKTTFWVATNLLDAEWKQLPLISPQQLKVSRNIKYTFTGDLQRDIFSNPFFPGKQSHLLKCQLIRINFTCNLIPRTMYNVNAEDKKQIQPAQEWKVPTLQFLASLENWVHHSQNILKNGRTTLLKPEPVGDEEIDQEKLMKEMEQKDPMQERLKPLSRDTQAWAIKKVGDCSQYRAMTKAVEYTNYGYVHIKSLVWRGWHLIFHNKQWTNIYVGDGFKTASKWFYPKEPEVVLQECQDREEVSEPNFPPQQPKVQGAESGEPAADEE